VRKGGRERERDERETGPGGGGAEGLGEMVRPCVEGKEEGAMACSVCEATTYQKVCRADHVWQAQLRLR
jgi:hypothetical protein